MAIDKDVRDFRVHPMTMQERMRRADADKGSRPGETLTDAAEIRERRERNRRLEHDVEVWRRAAADYSQANPPGE